tara:strand:- start:2382 stop:3530 length:1149 start_codon:yes stop_codon:yes gene_type:complete
VRTKINGNKFNLQANLFERFLFSLVLYKNDKLNSISVQNERAKLIARMISIERWFILRGATAGAICGIVCSLGVYLAEPFWIEGPSPLIELLPYYCISLGIGAIATLFEICYLYWDGARCSLSMGILAGVMKEEGRDDLEAIDLSLLRAGLETPPCTQIWHGIDPLFGISRFRIISVALLYKLKIAATSALVKGLVRKIVARLSGRVVARSLVELVTVPVFALWNAFICRKIMREARLRALGPHLVIEIYKNTFPQGFSTLEKALQEAYLLSIREKIVTSNCRHPNLARMARKMFDEASVSTSKLFDNQCLVSKISKMSLSMQKMVFEFLIAISALDGKITKKERLMIARIAGFVKVDPALAIRKAKLYAASAIDKGFILQA